MYIGAPEYSTSMCNLFASSAICFASKSFEFKNFSILLKDINESFNEVKNQGKEFNGSDNELKIYKTLGLVEFSVEPHFDKDNISQELLILSEEYPLYGLCDDSAVICADNNITYVGDIFLIDKCAVTSV